MDSLNSSIIQNQINEMLHIQLCRWIFKIHKDQDYLKLPVVKKFISTIIKEQTKNKIYYSKFYKDFKIENWLVYLNEKIKDLIETVIKNKNNNTNDEKMYMYMLDIFLIINLIDYVENMAHWTDKKELWLIANFLWLQEVEFVYKKVKWKLEKFITKDMLFKNDKIVWFYQYDHSYDRVFFSVENAKDIRAIRQKWDKIEKLKILNIARSIRAIWLLKRRPDSIYTNLILYFLTLSLLEYIQKLKKQDIYLSEKDQKLFNLYIKTFIGYIYHDEQVKELLWFNKDDINIFYNEQDRIALSNLLKNYFATLIAELKCQIETIVK